MKKTNTLKKMLAIVLSLAMLVGTWTMPGVMKANASAEDNKTGALSLSNSQWAKTTEIHFKTERLALNNTVAKSLTPVDGKAGMLHNGVAFNGSIRNIDTEGAISTNWLYWTIPGVQEMGIQTGDELKIFGEFTYDDGQSSIWITPTVIRCTGLNATGNGAYWELVSSEDETTETEEHLSISDFHSSDEIAATTTATTTYTTSKSLVGNSFKTKITYEDVAGTSEGKGWNALYYGANSADMTNCISVFVNKWNVVWIYINGAEGYGDVATYQGPKVPTKGEGALELLLEIDISEAVSGKSTITIKLGGEQVLQKEGVDTSAYQNQMIVQNDAARVSAVYRDYGIVQLKQLMDEAPEITAVDFGLQDGVYTSQDQTWEYNRSIDGKKLVMEVSDVESANCVALDYGNFALYLQKENKGVKVYHRVRDVAVKENYSVSSPYKVEIYTEYIDSDGDGIKDDMRSLVRVNGELLSLSSSSSCTCNSTTKKNYWLYTTDRLYKECSTIRLYSPSQDWSKITSYKVTSLNTHTKAELTEGVLTISGKGTVLPSVLNGVVNDVTAVSDVVIQDGITAVSANVFNGFTNLKTVTYADSVESVSETAFVGCSEGVEVRCPAGKDFIGGLVNAIIVKAVTNIAVPNTGIVNPAVVVTRVDSQERYNDLSGSAVAILNIDSQLNVLDKSGQKIGTVADYMEKYKHTVIPAFYLDDETEITTLCSYLSYEKNNVRDAFYVTKSSNAALLKQARESWSYVRGILEYDTLPTTLQGRGADRRDINNNFAMVAIYPSKDLTADIVAEYNLRGISVWSYAEDTGDVYAGISNGVNGLVTSVPSTVLTVYEGITEKTLSGKPQAIAHRGLYYVHNNSGNVTSFPYPQNTLEAYKYSVAQGCTALEMDLQLTKDNQLILKSGNITLQGAEDGAKIVSNYTLAELKNFDLVKDEASYKVPSLREVFEEFKDTNVALYLHVNYVTDNNIANYEQIQRDALHTLIKEYEDAGYSIADNVVVLHRGMNASAYRGEYGLSLIGGTFSGEKDGIYTEEVLSEQYKYIKALNDQLSPGNFQQLPYHYDLVGTDDSLSYRMAARGYLTLQSVNDAETQNSLDNYFINNFGSTAILTNSFEFVQDYHYQLDAMDETWVVGETINLSNKVKKIVGENVVSCGLIDANEGETLATAESDYVVDGAVSKEVVYYADITLTRNYGELTYRIYSNPVTINVVADEHLGDPNGDNERTVVDLVKMIKAVSSTKASVKIYDVNRSGVVDKDDIAFMREVLVGKSTLSSIYGNNAQIQLAAFMGPPTSGGTYDGEECP